VNTYCILNFIEFYFLICTAAMNKQYSQLLAFRDQGYLLKVQRVRSTTVHSNLQYRRRIKIMNSTGKFSVLIFIITPNLFLAVLIEVLCLFCVISGPAHILCLNVASGWNKERCTPEIEAIVTLSANPPFWFNCFKYYCPVWLYL
jgi:hypothetical protein